MATKKSVAGKAARAESVSLRVQGIAAILFGVLAVGWPGLTVELLVLLFALFLLVDGLVLLVMGLMRRKSARKAALMAVLGLLQLGLGAVLLPRPEAGFDTLVIILGLALIARGLFALLHSFTDDQSSYLRTMHGALAVLGVGIGVAVLLLPLGASLAFILMLGLYALVAGVTMLAMSADIGKRLKKS
jgi:uncharacterized membrane protein HdeD (DUF308 family)